MQKKKQNDFTSKTLLELFEYLNNFDKKLFRIVLDAEKLMRSRDYDGVRRKLKEIKELL